MGVIIAFFHQSFWPITFLASFLVWIMFAALLTLWAFDKRIKKEQVFHAVVASFMAWLLSEAIKNWFPTVRPFEVNHQHALTLFTPNDSAFPSDHSAIAFGLAVSVWSHHKKLGIVFIVAAMLVGVGRVLGNVHYYTDIVGGAVLGVVSVIILEKLHVALEKGGTKRRKRK